jgi:hypothetical protein
MADIHVLTESGSGEWRVVMHFAVPDLNNEAGKSYRVALVNSGLGGQTILPEGTGPGQIEPTEVAAIGTGEVYEHLESFRLESGGTTAAERRTALLARYAARKPVMWDKLKKQLRYFGHIENEE